MKGEKIEETGGNLTNKRVAAMGMTKKKRRGEKEGIKKERGKGKQEQDRMRGRVKKKKTSEWKSAGKERGGCRNGRQMEDGERDR